MQLKFSESPEISAIEFDIVKELFLAASKMQTEITEMIDIRIVYNDFLKDKNTDIPKKIYTALNNAFKITALSQTKNSIVIRPDSWETTGISILKQICINGR